MSRSIALLPKLRPGKMHVAVVNGQLALLFKYMEWLRAVAQAMTSSCPAALVSPVQFNNKSSTDTSIGNSRTSEICYRNPLLPITRLRNALVNSFPGIAIGTPTEFGTCDLTATRNVFGRLVNGIPESDLCLNSNIRCTCTGTGGCMGKFVHIEQDPAYRLDVFYGSWASAINAVFPPHVPVTITNEQNVLEMQ
jgi:hypothetical protein